MKIIGEKNGFKISDIFFRGESKSFEDYKFYIGMDPNKVISKKLNGMVMPTMILVDKGGEVKWRHQGYIPGEEIETKNQIEQLLRKYYD